MEGLDRDVTLRRDLGLVLAAGHLGMVLLAIFNRMEYFVPPRHSEVGLLADSWGWGPIHGVVAIALIVTAVRRRNENLAVGASTGVFGVWSVLESLWALEAIRPVSLVAPVLGFVLATLGWRLTRSWEDNRDEPVV